MTTLIDEQKKQICLDMTRLTKDLFIYSTWFGNLFINTKDINIKLEELK